MRPCNVYYLGILFKDDLPDGGVHEISEKRNTSEDQQILTG